MSLQLIRKTNSIFMWICIFGGVAALLWLVSAVSHVLTSVGQTGYFFLQGKSYWWPFLSVMQCFRYWELEEGWSWEQIKAGKHRSCGTGGEEFINSLELAKIFWIYEFQAKILLQRSSHRATCFRLETVSTSGRVTKFFMVNNLYKMKGKMCGMVGDLT